MLTRIEGVRRAVYSAPWMIQPEKLDAILDLIDLRAAGVVFSDEERARRIARPERRDVIVDADDLDDGDEAAQPEPGAGLVVLRLFDTILPRATMMDQMSGATSARVFGAQLAAAVQDPAVRGILVDIDSPGGSVHGVPELAAQLFAARQAKPIVAVSNHLMASAALYVGAGAGQVWVSPSSDNGSLGVYMVHTDVSRLEQNEGVTRTFISAGRYKVEGNPYEPLGQEAHDYLQSRVDALYRRFVEDVARYRGLAPVDVEERFGQGRTMGADEAVAAGMADRVGTLDEALADLTAQVHQDDTRAFTVQRSLPEDAERRSLGGESRAAEGADGAERLEGVAVRYGSMSVEMRGFRELFEDGAFADSLASDDVRVVWQHDPSKVLGRVRAGTARVWEEGGELRYQAHPPQASWARDAMESIRRGDVNQNSFTFRVAEGGERWERRDGQLVRVISRARLFEVGPQTNPAYPDTSVAVRSMAAFLESEAAGATVEIPHGAAMDLLRRRQALAELDV